MVDRYEEGWLGSKGQYFETADAAIASLKDVVEDAIDGISVEIIPYDARQAIKDKIYSMLDRGVDSLQEVINKIPFEFTKSLAEYQDVIIETLQKILS